MCIAVPNHLPHSRDLNPAQLYIPPHTPQQVKTSRNGSTLKWAFELYMFCWLSVLACVAANNIHSLKAGLWCFRHNSLPQQSILLLKHQRREIPAGLSLLWCTSSQSWLLLEESEPLSSVSISETLLSSAFSQLGVSHLSCVFTFKWLWNPSLPTAPALFQRREHRRERIERFRKSYIGTLNTYLWMGSVSLQRNLSRSMAPRSRKKSTLSFDVLYTTGQRDTLAMTRKHLSVYRSP